MSLIVVKLNSITTSTLAINAITNCQELLLNAILILADPIGDMGDKAKIELYRYITENKESKYLHI